MRFFAVILGMGLMAAMASAGQVTIGTGTTTWSYPLSTDYHDARTQTIYLASEIGAAKILTSLDLYVSTLPGQTMNNFTIRLKHTNLTSYSTSSVWESSGWTIVYQANQTISTTGWVTFNFSTLFSYNGTQNLMVDISFNNSSGSSDGYCQRSAISGNRTISFRTNSGYGDPLTWASSTPAPIVNIYFPNIRLGDNAVTIPDVVGMTHLEAQTAIITAGLAIGEVALEINESVPAGTVISQSPSAGTLVGMNWAVNLVIAGRAVTVPDVSGLTRIDAQTTITTAELATGDLTQAFSESIPEGKIISQSPAAGQTVPSGTAIDLVLSLGTHYSGGSGSELDPYLIYTPRDLNLIGATPADWRKYFKLMADIDMSVYTGTQYKIIGNSTTQFVGTFDGNNHKIINLTYTTSNTVKYVGMFGCTNNATIKNLGLENVNISVYGNCTGGLIGKQSSGTITSCYSTGSVKANCTSGSPAQSCVGGLVGLQSYTSCTLTYCYSTASVTSLSNDHSWGGGLVGVQDGTLTHCYSTGSVRSSSSEYSCAGGLVGTQNNGLIMNCYSMGSVNCSSSSCTAGGLAGNQGQGGAIINCYCTGAVLNGAGEEGVGGLIGSGSDVINSFWDTQTSGQMTSGGGYGRTTVQMKQPDNYIGWNKLEQTDWTIHEGVDYPRLAWQNQPGIPLPLQTLSDYIAGVGTTSNPYQISTPQQLNIVGLFPEEWDKVFRLENDIDVSFFTGTAFNRIGMCENKYFRGTFDGNGHVIRNLTYTSTYFVRYVGLFGYTNNATIKDLGVENISFSVRGLCIGGLAGYQESGTITDCFSSGSIATTSSTISSTIGGLVGTQEYGTISGCYSTVSVTSATSSSEGHSYSCAGGLVGDQFYGNIVNCYSTGSVISSCTAYGDAFSRAGGLVGSQFNSSNTKIEKCYSTGRVTASGEFVYQGGLIGDRSGSNSKVTDSFWDIETSGMTTSPGGTGKTTAEMQILSTFLSAGWDFTEDDGNPAVWTILSGYYPQLTGPRSVPVPNVVNMAQVPAETTITAAGFVVGDVTREFSEIVLAGNIISQSPAAEVSVGVGTSIDLVVSRGRAVSVPEVTGMTQTDAESAITTSELIVGTITTAYHNSVLAGHVISQSTAAGTLVEVGSIIDMTVSLGRPVVPDVVGIQQSAAQSAIISAGVAVGTVTMVYDASIPEGNVISQSLPAGTLVDVGTLVNLVVSRGLCPYSRGSGTAADPYQIASTDELTALGSKTGDYGKCFILTTDIDLSGRIFTTAIIGSKSETAFTGTFDGNGHVVRNLTITSSINNDYIGLFGCINGATIKNLGFENVNISANSRYAGSLAGYQESGSITNCHSSGSVVTPSINKTCFVGNLIGFSNKGTILTCYSTGIVTVSAAASSITTCVGGLAGVLQNGIIRDCYYAGSVVSSSSSYITSNVGGLAGYLNYSTMSDCFSTGSANASCAVQMMYNVNVISGGLVGKQISGTVANCYSTGTVISSCAAGGLIGLSSGSITGCYSSGDVSGEYDVGGFIGSCGGSEPITACYSSSNVFGGDNAGGFAGIACFAYITACYSTGHVQGDSNVGGLIGSNVCGSGYIPLFSYITSCYSTSQVDGNSCVGGLVGFNSNNIKMCYSVGAVSGTSDVGGFVGKHSPPATTTPPTISGSFWDNETSGQTASAGGSGRTTVQMKTLVTFTSAGWDFSPTWVDYDGRDWILLSEGLEYPKLRFQIPFPHGGTGTKNDPYQVADVNDVLLLTDAQWSKHYILTSDIDMGGFTFPYAIMAPDADYSKAGFQGTAFTGSFDGNGHKIIHYTINGASRYYVGFIGYLGDGGEIKNLGLENFTISGSGPYYAGGIAGYTSAGSIRNCHTVGTISSMNSYIGGLVGENHSEISFCYSNCTVKGSQYTGGLIGRNYGDTHFCYSMGSVEGGYYTGGLIGGNYLNINVNQCYSTCNFKGSSYTGGLIGSNNGNVRNCYSRGLALSSSSYIGGLIGSNGSSGIIDFCYSTGSVSGSGNGGIIGSNADGSVSHSFWNTETSGLTDGVGNLNPDPNGIKGKSTAEMQMLSTYSVDGWDFAFETANGTDDIWRMCADGVVYPRLSWEFPAGDFVCPDGVGVEDLSVLSACWLETAQAKADIDNNDAVDFGDVLKLSQNWLLAGCGLCNGADISGDGSVNELDLSLMTDQWLMIENVGCRMGDLNNDGGVDLGDWSVFAGNWMEGI